MFSKIKYLAVATAFVLSPVVVSAATLLTDGGVYDIGIAETEFAGIVVAGGGAGQWKVSFKADTDPVNADASASIRDIPLGEFTNLTMSWFDTLTGNLLSSTAILLGDTFLATVFTIPNLDQDLVLSWTNSKKGFGFDVQVAATVPLPAGGLLLLGALGGIAALRRRKTA